MSGGARNGAFLRGAAVVAAWSWVVACEAVRQPAPVVVNPPVAVGSTVLPPEEIRAHLASELGFTSRGGEVFCSYTVLGRQRDQVYLATACEELLPHADSLQSGSGRGGPVALVLDTLARPVRIVEHRVPGDGNRYGRDIQRIFPEPVQRRIRADVAEQNRQSVALRAANRAAAMARFAPELQAAER